MLPHSACHQPLLVVQACGSAATCGGNEIVLCSYNIAHEGEVGYHIECCDSLQQGVPEGDWKCPLCEEHEATQDCRYEIECLLNKRQGTVLKHTSACANRQHSNCKCRTKGQATMYLVKWKGYADTDNSWVADTEVHLDYKQAFKSKLSNEGIQVGKASCKEWSGALDVFLNIT